MSPRVLYLSDELAAQMLGAAARAFPLECCGLIEGMRVESGWRAAALHQSANLAEDPARRFLIDPQRQFDLMRALREGETRIIGCFHSHPNGSPEPSATDRANGLESDFLWLIAGGSPEGGFTLKAYLVWDEGSCEVVLRAA